MEISADNNREVSYEGDGLLSVVFYGSLQEFPELLLLVCGWFVKRYFLNPPFMIIISFYNNTNPYLNIIYAHLI